MNIDDRKQKDVNCFSQRLFQENCSEFVPYVPLLSKNEEERIMEEQSAILATFSDMKTKPDDKIRGATECVDKLLVIALNHLLVMSKDVQGVLVKTSEALSELENKNDTSPTHWKRFMAICHNLENNLLPKNPDNLSHSLLRIEDKVSNSLEQVEDLKEAAVFFTAANMLQVTITALKAIECSVRGCLFSVLGIEIEKDSCGLKRYGVSWSRLNYSVKAVREVLGDQFFSYAWRLSALAKSRKTVPSQLSVLLEQLKKPIPKEEPEEKLCFTQKELCEESKLSVRTIQRDVQDGFNMAGGVTAKEYLKFRKKNKDRKRSTKKQR